MDSVDVVCVRVCVYAKSTVSGVNAGTPDRVGSGRVRWSVPERGTDFLTTKGSVGRHTHGVPGGGKRTTVVTGPRVKRNHRSVRSFFDRGLGTLVTLEFRLRRHRSRDVRIPPTGGWVPGWTRSGTGSSTSVSGPGSGRRRRLGVSMGGRTSSCAPSRKVGPGLLHPCHDPRSPPPGLLR